MTERKSTLVLKKGEQVLTSSDIFLLSRKAGAYLEADLSLSADVQVGDEISIWYKDEISETLMVTVAVFAIPKRYGKLVVLAADTYREKLKTVVSSAGWRNASAKEILESVFEECDVEKYDLSALPEMKFPHFSYHDKNGWSILEQVLEALHKATGIYQHLIPKVDGTLYCGELKTVAPEKSSVDVTDEDLISSGEKHFHFHLLPILYAQTFDFNGTEVRTTNVCHRVSPKDRESEVWIS